MCLGVAGTAQATETDQYFAIGKPLPDSLDILNEKVNRDILGALALVNRRGDWERYSCEDVSQRIYQRFRIAGLHKIELWAEQTPRIDRVPSEDDYARFLEEQSLYRNDRLWDWGLTFGVKPTLKVAGVHLGADKLSHFFQLGWKYHKRFLEAVQEGVPEREALERIARYGVRTESGSLGLPATGVFSFADLEANYQGFLFYRSLCREEDPRLLRTAEGWRLTQPFDWREFVSPRLDESVYNSAFTQRRWSEVRANLRRDYCPRLDSEAFLEHYRHYTRFAWEADDFNARYVRELLTLGEVPRQADFSIWAACDRSPPAFEPPGAVVPVGSVEPLPRYEAPRFEGALFRPLLEVGGGGLIGADSKWNTLLRTRFVLRETVVPEDEWDVVQTPEYLLWASLDGSLAVSSTALTRAELRFTPVERRFALNDVSSGHTMAVGVALSPIRATRFVALDRRLGIEVSAVGLRGALETRLGARQRVGVFASLAVDSPGYKTALHLTESNTFHGVHVGTFAVETGAELFLGDQVRAGVLLGGEAGLDLGWWNQGNAGFTTLSELEAHAEARVEVTRFFRLFARGQLDVIREPGSTRLLSEPTFRAGAVLRF